MRGENTTESKVDTTNNTATNGEKGNHVRKAKGNKLNVVLGLIIVLLLGVVLFMGYQILQEEPEKEESYDGRATFVDQGNVDEIKDSLDDEIEDATYTASMTVDWRFYDGKSVSTTAFVENMKDNKRTVYFDVNLKSTGELVYSSPYLPVGAKLEGFALDKALPKGDYPAVVTYFLVDDDHKVITKVSVAITIHVLN